jgi:xanthine dehydrogenase YagR molybdenum-binding subunit
MSFHPLLTIDDLQYGEEIPVVELLDKAKRQLDEFTGSVDALIGFWDFPLSTMVPLLCRYSGTSCPSLEAVVKCEHKYWALPVATVAGGSSGISSWGTTIVAAARAFRDKHGTDPAPGDHATATTPENPDGEHFSLHSFGAQFAEVSVDVDTGEARVPRMLGVFSVGRIINPRTARSQFIGGMTMGLSMALHEEGVFDTNTGHVVNHDLAGYHIPTNADVGDLEAVWLDEHDPHANPMGARGIGEIGIVGAAAAIANAVYNATGIRVRDLPITPDKLVR